jgi:predicted Zn-dependent peptidase
MEEYNIHTLPNGIRILHKQVTYTKIAHCGFILDIGSRDEKPTNKVLPIFGNIWLLKGLKTQVISYH